MNIAFSKRREMRKMYIMLLYVSGLIITAYSSLYGADRKEHKAERKTYESKTFEFDCVETYRVCHKEGRYALTKLRQTVDNVFTLPTKQAALAEALRQGDKGAIQFYARGLNIWPYYIEAIKAGKIDNVRILLPLMMTKTTYPKNGIDKDDKDLPMRDCSGLVTAIESELSDAAKMALMDTIINFYQPLTLKCGPSCCFSCTSRCNQRRATLIIYGKAKAGKRCLERKGSKELLTYIYDTHQAYIPNDIIKILKIQGNIDLMNKFQERQTRQNREKQLLLSFNCFEETLIYYLQVAQPVICNNKPDVPCWSPWQTLCHKG